MAGITTLGVDTVALKESVTNKSLNSTSGSAFDKTLNTVGYLNGAVGPAAVEWTNYSKGENAASIVSAAVNGSPMSLTTGSTTFSGSIGTTGSENYVTGGASMMSTTGTTGTTGTATDVQSVISESYANQTYLLAVQSELGQIQTQTNALSQVISAKFSTNSKIIQNFRVG